MFYGATEITLLDNDGRKQMQDMDIEGRSGRGFISTFKNYQK